MSYKGVHSFLLEYLTEKNTQNPFKWAIAFGFWLKSQSHSIKVFHIKVRRRKKTQTTNNGLLVLCEKKNPVHIVIGWRRIVLWQGEKTG